LGAVHQLDIDEMSPREGGSRAPEAFEVSAEAKAALRAQLKGPLPAAPPRPLDEPPCGAGRALLIEPNGELRPCTSLEFDLGHALRDGVANAHASNERALAIRSLTWASLHGCRDCDLRAHCSHCYASALAQTGDALGPYPSACKAALASYAAEKPGAHVAARPLGPFREVADGVLESAHDVVTAEDDAIALRLGWARRAAGPVSPPSAQARPGDLVQIRRPGRKKSHLARIPAPTLERELTEA
jgi:radical SAM protein with 4Fe4S-binding SPASM domain